MRTERAARGWLLLALVAVVVQEALTGYPGSQAGARVSWAALSLVLLWFVHRRSIVARLLVAAMAAFGFAIYLLASVDEFTSTGTMLALLYAVQAGAMLVRPARLWTRVEPAPSAFPIA